jgi:hypothetical protein
MTPDQLTAGITDLARSAADIHSRLSDMAAQLQCPMPPSLPYRIMMLLSFQDVQPTVLPFQGVQPTAPPFQGMQATAAVVHQPWMLPSPLPIPSYVLAPTMGLLYTKASATTAMTMVPPAPTIGAVVLHGGPSLEHLFTEGIFYWGVGVQ